MKARLILTVTWLCSCSDAPTETRDARTDAAANDAAEVVAGDASAADTGVREDAAAAEDAAAPDVPVEPMLRTALNPVLAGDHPDPGILRIVDPEGRPTFYLTPTAGDGGDLQIYRSHDLIDWTLLPEGLFRRPRTPGDSLEIHGWHYCALWAPQIVQLGPESFMLSFSATRYQAPQSPCPGYRENSGVYLAWSRSPEGPFADDDHPWEALPAGGQISTCALRDELPRSLDRALETCRGGPCHHIIRLDSDVFADPSTGRWWMAYSWYTNRPPLVPWELDNHGEHVNLVELDPADPFAVICDLAVPQLGIANPHDQTTLDRLRTSCPRCGEMLSNTRGRFGEEVLFDGYSWGVTEGTSLFRRGAWVYALISGSLWDSPYYHVYWVAAPSVEELRYDNPARLVGRYLIPSDEQAFGHGSAVLGPDGEHWYFVHHRLGHRRCVDAGDCSRDVWVSPIEFEDHGDGLGEVHIAPRFPAETPETSVHLPE